jgi:hydrogenase nickel incorporation protein HypA/HybF
MHELPILRSIVDVALRHAEEAGATRVVAVDLEVGELRDLDEAWMQRYFDFVTAGTTAEAATLRVRRSKALFLCRACGATFAFDLRSGSRVVCAACSSNKIELTTGNELRIESIDVL